MGIQFLKTEECVQECIRMGPSSGLGIRRWDCVMLNLLFFSIAFGESRFGVMNEIIHLKSGNLWKKGMSLNI